MDGTDVASTQVADAGGVAVAHGMTVAELHAMEGTDDGRRRELIDGELFVSPAPRLGHQEVVLRLATALRTALPDWRVLPAPVDVWVDVTTVVQPDVVGYSPKAAATLDPMGSAEQGLVPELVIEVSSPSTRRLDLVWKRALYERLPIREYWFADLDAGVIDVLGRDDVEGTFGLPRSADARSLVQSSLVDLEPTVDDLLSW